MADLNDIPGWPGVYRIETVDPVVGGEPNPETGEGMTNIPALQLAMRTAWLRRELGIATNLINRTSADVDVDPNETLLPWVFTNHSNAPPSSAGGGWIINTILLNSNTGRRLQIASKLGGTGLQFRTRTIADGWSNWALPNSGPEGDFDAATVGGQSAAQVAAHANTTGATDVDPDTVTVPWAYIAHANAPDSGSWWINTIIAAFDNDRRLQIAYSATSATSARRVCGSNGWTEWIAA